MIYEPLEERTVYNEPLHRALTKSRSCVMPDGHTDIIPVGYEWDGSSVPFFLQGTFPRWRHPIASVKHDWRCEKATNESERKFADEQFEKDVGKTSWWVTKKLGYVGVRFGSFFGIGNRF